MPNRNPKAALSTLELTLYVTSTAATQSLTDQGQLRLHESRGIKGRALMTVPTLSQEEIKALRLVAYGLASFLPSVRRARLATLGLVAVNGGRRLVLTHAGKVHLASADEAEFQAARKGSEP